MKVLIYGDCFLPSVGGVQTAMELLARGLAEFRNGADPGEPVPVEVTLATNTARGEMDESRLPYLVVRRPGFQRLLRLVRDTDVVHLAGPCFLPMFLAWLLRKPYVVVHHVYQAVCPNGLLFKQPSRTVCAGHFMNREYWKCLRCCKQTMGTVGGIRSLLLEFPRRWLCQHASSNVMVTEHVAARVRLPRERTIYHGISEIAPTTLLHNAGHSSPVEFGYVGRFVAEKGLPVLLEAAKQLADGGRTFRLIFIGDGPLRANIEALAHTFRLGDRIRFAGFLQGDALQRAASQLGVLIMPSIWEESAGLAAIEQMMRGRMVIAADIGGLGEIIGNAGLKFTMGDSRSLAASMQRVIDDPSLMASYGAAARVRAMKLFRHDLMIESHIAICRDIVRDIAPARAVGPN